MTDVLVMEQGNCYHKIVQKDSNKPTKCKTFFSKQCVVLSKEKAEEKGYTKCKSCYKNEVED